ncbi:MAG: Hpt domain-containing protein [Flavobacteriales bacterium]|nr:Hpt domain-containing protein [Flavobacteriales bacterium]MBP9080835.1 Hpt domain-containing protein [Flavobacteriales bacterium]
MPAIDLSYLERLYKGDRTRMATWVGIYLEETPARLAELMSFAQRGDHAGMARLAHDLKPQAHYLGARCMLEALLRIGEPAPGTAAEALLEWAQAIDAAGTEVDMELRALFPG